MTSFDPASCLFVSLVFAAYTVHENLSVLCFSPERGQEIENVWYYILSSSTHELSRLCCIFSVFRAGDEDKAYFCSFVPC